VQPLVVASEDAASPVTLVAAELDRRSLGGQAEGMVPMGQVMLGVGRMALRTDIQRLRVPR
jgi:hypothetical protein